MVYEISVFHHVTKACVLLYTTGSLLDDSMSILSSVSLWKAHRQEIIRCVDCILARLKTGKVLDITAALDEQELSHFRREVWSKVLTSMQDQIVSLKQPQPTSWAEGKQVQPASSVVLLIDDNMFYRSMRYEYYQLARKYNTSFCQVYLQCNTEVALARNSQRRNVVPEETVRKMANRMEVPDRQVASWEKHTLCIEAKGLENEATLSTVWALIAEALLDPVLPMEVENAEEREASRVVCAASAIHQADQSLRRCVAEAVTAAKEGGSLSKAELRNLGSKLNDVRQTVLQKIRTREIWPPPLVAAAVDHPDNAERCSDFYAFIRNLFLKEQQAS
ncbi:L-seryl-tRNA(Sec) kinase-like isoform X2 [Acanthaster planci]|uniref:L-seryl-tRNA(Sec) kinase-like isoform X2 n=1 Tax=Acanthaster planci TaxID=133434 RepID=A0A8B7Y447_ACAPL|nr:L-seryl-tRNA(Sec) kinase-like isoform X2 [Acanthaster planci]